MQSHSSCVFMTPGVKEPQEAPRGPPALPCSSCEPALLELLRHQPCLQRRDPQTLGDASAPLPWQVACPLGLPVEHKHLQPACHRLHHAYKNLIIHDNNSDSDDHSDGQGDEEERCKLLPIQLYLPLKFKN